MAGAIVATVIGFAWGGWTTAGTTQKMADQMVDAAVLASRAAICVAQFMNEPNYQERFDDLQKMNAWDRFQAIETGGWDKMPGQQNAVHSVSRACVDGLEHLLKK